MLLGNGFYLYSKDQLSENIQCNRSNTNVMFITETEKPMLIYTEEKDTPVQIIMVSLWFWW